jgi:hypothetical protein
MCCLGYEYSEGESYTGQRKAEEKVMATANDEAEVSEEASDALSAEIVCCAAVQTPQKSENIPATSEIKGEAQKPEGTNSPRRRRRRRHRRRGPKKDE